ncbi:hypothetical protein [Chamaesiphon sp. VAR_48_metabat_403]|uniref:hypothetical protein n=1 Tax=Chamaesiphon sp. VAR_48_metabat_403 TaxID=2964700 RepID=UPI00286E8971|nr:hypothetical protein [Chamaesiphon sp. VAR_48_metabat_403]
MTSQEMLNEFSSLPQEAQRQVMSFIAFLRSNYTPTESSVQIVDATYPAPKFYGCIDDETFLRHPQGEQSEREPIL